MLAELGKKIAERWLSLLALPGALWLATLTTAHVLGQRHALDVSRLVRRIDGWASSATGRSPSGLAVVLLAVLLGSAGVGLAAQAVGVAAERLSLAAEWARWPPPLRQFARWRVTRRRERWDELVQARDAQTELRRRARARSRITGLPDPDPTADPGRSPRDPTLISPERPARPTWSGDRLHAVELRLNRDCRVDLPTVWPALWLALPDSVRGEITATREALARAMVLGGWGILYVLPAFLWWPSALIACAVVATAWPRARAMTDAYAMLLEGAVRLHALDLARSVGVPHVERLDKTTGWQLTCILQGRGDLIELTSPEPPTAA
ncbi:hypothetical protein AB0B01_27475 [Streptomyces sp. NPDC044571]|uniref:hypothetical protein n=1 Tax=Streptomyces sp. NPDC044571 TaxID=3155371 RepID=UPI0033F5A431